MLGIKTFDDLHDFGEALEAPDSLFGESVLDTGEDCLAFFVIVGVTVEPRVGNSPLKVIRLTDQFGYRYGGHGPDLFMAICPTIFFF